LAQTIEENKAIVRRWVDEVFNQHCLNSVEHLKVGGYIDWNPYPNQQSALSGFKSVLAAFFDAFPDFRYEVAEELGESDSIVCIGTWRGTHSGSLMGLPPTGKQLSGRRIDVVRISGDKMTERWGTGNELKMMELFGLGDVARSSDAPRDARTLVRRFVDEVLNRRNLVAVDELVSEEATQNPQGTFAMFMACMACPDGQFRVRDLINEGDKTVAVLTFSGTHQRAINGVPPSGRQVNADAILSVRVAEGKIVDSHCDLSVEALLRQLKSSSPGAPEPVSARAGVGS
jgi:predicted ester cyclase